MKPFVPLDPVMTEASAPAYSYITQVSAFYHLCKSVWVGVFLLKESCVCIFGNKLNENKLSEIRVTLIITSLLLLF